MRWWVKKLAYKTRQISLISLWHVLKIVFSIVSWLYCLISTNHSYVTLQSSKKCSWNPKQPFINRCLVISNHFLCKDWVHHPIDGQPFINGWPWGSRILYPPLLFFATSWPAESWWFLGAIKLRLPVFTRTFPSGLNVMPHAFSLFTQKIRSKKKHHYIDTYIYIVYIYLIYFASRFQKSSEISFLWEISSNLNDLIRRLFLTAQNPFQNSRKFNPRNKHQKSGTCSLTLLYIYTHLEPNWPLFLKVNPPNKALFNQNTGHLGARYIYIYLMEKLSIGRIRSFFFPASFSMFSKQKCSFNPTG